MADECSQPLMASSGWFSSLYEAELEGNKMEFTVVLEDISSNRSNVNCSSSAPGSPNENDRKRLRRPYQSKTYKVEISFAARIPMQAIAQALRGQDSENSQEALRVFDIILRQHADKQGCLLVRQSFFHNGVNNFSDVGGGGVIGCHGFHCSFRTTQGRLSLDIDVSTTMIVHPGAVVVFLIANQNVKDPLSLHWAKAKGVLKNFRVTTSPTNTEYKISGLSQKTCKEQTLSLKQKTGDVNGEAQTTEITVYDYFVNLRSIPLYYFAEVPCINVGKPKRPIYFPLELKVGNREDFFPRNGCRNLDNKKLVDPTTIDHWVVANFSARCNIQSLISDIIKCGGMKGTNIARPFDVFEESPQHRRAPPLVRVEKMFESIQSKLLVAPQFLPCLLPERKNSLLYGPWKRKNLAEYGIVTQCIAPSRVNDQNLTNVLLNINAKLGGLNSKLSVEHSPSIPLVSKAPTIIVGMDVSRGSPGQSDVPFIAAIVSSRQWPLISNYRASGRTQSLKVEMIDSLFKKVSDNGNDGIMRELLLDLYTSSEKRKPDQIIMFRDGVSESQFDQVLNVELNQIIEACKFLDEKWCPKSVVIIAQKNHRTEFLQPASPDNVAPGTVIDNRICHPPNDDFYLCAQAGMIGTTRPTHYHVLLDEVGFSGDDLQEFVRSLSSEYSTQHGLLEDKMQQGDVGDVPASVLNPGDFCSTVDLTCASQAKIAVLDSGCSGRLTLADLECFERKPAAKVFHNCRGEAIISPHGFSCASLVCGKLRRVNFFDVCEKEIKGVVPCAQLHTYAIGCGSCGPSDSLMCDAIDEAIKDGNKVISMSQGPTARANAKSVEDDKIGLKLLDAFNANVVSCVPVGNEGPVEGSAVHGMPWCITVGGCTSGEVLVTEIEVATNEDVPGVEILGRTHDGNGEFMIIDRLQGVSLNVIQSNFRKLKFSKDTKGKACILYAIESTNQAIVLPASPQYKSLIVTPGVSAKSVASISKDVTDQLYTWRYKLGRRQLFVRILKSRYQKDPRGILVTDFSSRGPSRLYKDNITPDVIAPAYAVLVSHLSSIALNRKECEESLLKEMFKNCKIGSGTSYSSPLVAACALVICSYHPDWNPSVVKSALITTASSFAARGAPGNEFAFGAGSIDLKSALDPGLVYEECGTNFQEYVDKKREIFNLNLPSFAASFSHSHQYCNRVFTRELKNVGEGSAVYKFEVEYFNKYSDDNVEIKAEPDYLEFGPGEKKKFLLRVRVCPHPRANVSAMIKWVSINDGRYSVCSPIYLYHQCEFDEPVWYIDRERRRNPARRDPASVE